MLYFLKSQLFTIRNTDKRILIVIGIAFCSNMAHNVQKCSSKIVTLNYNFFSLIKLFFTEFQIIKYQFFHLNVIQDLRSLSRTNYTYIYLHCIGKHLHYFFIHSTMCFLSYNLVVNCTHVIIFVL